MAAKTGRVRVEPGGNRQRHTAARRPMTGGTTYAVHIQMASVIKLQIKTAQARKRFQGPGLYVRMADGADGTVGTGKLLRMTAGAGQVIRSAWAFWHCRV